MEREKEKKTEKGRTGKRREVKEKVFHREEGIGH